MNAATDFERWPEFDEVRVIMLPPPDTAAVNRLLREESGWRFVEAQVTERRVIEDEGDPINKPVVIYILGHLKTGMDTNSHKERS